MRTNDSFRPPSDEAAAFCSRLGRLLLPRRTIPSVAWRVHPGRPRRVRLRRLRPTFRNGCCISLATPGLRILSRGMLACWVLLLLEEIKIRDWKKKDATRCCSVSSVFELVYSSCGALVCLTGLSFSLRRIFKRRKISCNFSLGPLIWSFWEYYRYFPSFFCIPSLQARMFHVVLLFA